MKLIKFAALPVLAVTVAAVAVAAQKSLGEGVFSAAQAGRGKAQYEAHCINCHGETLSGNEAVPTLSGSMFLGSWNGLSAGDLFTRIRTTMPADAPGTLGDADVADVMAYLFKMNKFPAGSADLPHDPQGLGQIAITAGH